MQILDSNNEDELLREISIWKEIIEDDPKSAVAHFQLGTLSVSAGNIKEGINHLKISTDIKSDSFLFWNNLGTAYYLDNKYNKAAFAFEKAIDLNPYLSDQRHNLVNCYLKLGLTNEARNVLYEIVYRDSNDFRSYYRLGLLYAEENDFAKTLSLFLQAHKLKPDDVDTIYCIGSAYYDLNNHSKAIFFWEKVHSLDSLHAQCLYRLAKLSAEQYNREKTLYYLSKTILIDSDYKLLAMDNSVFDFIRQLTEFKDLVQIN